jgi:hypothetical protein
MPAPPSGPQGPVATLLPFNNLSAAATSVLSSEASITSVTSDVAGPSATTIDQPNKSASPQVSKNAASNSQVAKGFLVFGSFAAGLWSVI